MLSFLRVSRAFMYVIILRVSRAFMSVIILRGIHVIYVCYYGERDVA